MRWRTPRLGVLSDKANGSRTVRHRMESVQVRPAGLGDGCGVGYLSHGLALEGYLV